jgi:hypothetical protein
MVHPLAHVLPPITTPPDCSCLDLVVIAALGVQVKHIRPELTAISASFPQISEDGGEPGMEPRLGTLLVSG